MYNNMKNHKAVLISIRQLASMQKLMYCSTEISMRDSEFIPTIHLSKPLDETLLGSVFHPNASWEVRSRYRHQLIRMLEGKMIHMYVYES